MDLAAYRMLKRRLLLQYWLLLGHFKRFGIRGFEHMFSGNAIFNPTEERMCVKMIPENIINNIFLTFPSHKFYFNRNIYKFI